MLLDWYLNYFNYPKDFEILIEVQTALHFVKKLTILFYLLPTSIYLDINHIFMFLILLWARQYITTDKKTL